MYKVIEEKLINYGTVDGERTAFVLAHIVCDTASDKPQPLPHWVAGSRCDVLENNGTVYLLSNARQWEQVNFYNQGEGGEFDPDNYYTKDETDYEITEKVAEIVADAPQDFNTLKEISDWIAGHEDSAAAMNSAIRENTLAIAGKVDKVTGKGLSTEDYTSAEKTKLSGIEAGANNITVDSALSSSSTNPVQNKVINSKFGNYVEKTGYRGLTGTFAPNTDTASNLGTAMYRFYNIYGVNLYGTNLTLNNALSVANGGTGCTTLSDFKTTLGLEDSAYKGYTSSVTSGSTDLITSGAVYAGLENKVDKVTGKGLSTEDYTTNEKTKLAGIETGAEVNIQPDWEQSDSTADDFIKNKPTLGSAASRSAVLSLSNAGSGLPTSGTVYNALENKVDKVTGKGLSTEDYSTAEKTKLASIDDYANYVTIDSAISASSDNPVKSSAIYTALNACIQGTGNKGSAVDLNDYTSTQFFKVTSTQNGPSDTTYGICLVLNSSNYTAQFFLAYLTTDRNHHLYVRFNGGSWGSWIQCG